MRGMRGARTHPVPKGCGEVRDIRAGEGDVKGHAAARAPSRRSRRSPARTACKCLANLALKNFGQGYSIRFGAGSGRLGSSTGKARAVVRRNANAIESHLRMSRRRISAVAGHHTALPGYSACAEIERTRSKHAGSSCGRLTRPIGTGRGTHDPRPALAGAIPRRCASGNRR